MFLPFFGKFQTESASFPFLFEFMQSFFVSTPPGKGAIAVITLLAPRPSELVSTFFVPKSGKPLSSFAPGSIVYGHAAEEDVLVCPVSEHEMEIHCHGSLAAAERFKDFLQNLGAEEISIAQVPLLKELTENQRRAFAAILNAETMKTAAILWDQYEGAYERALENGENPECWNDVARHLTHPWKAVMVGKPNVGKSSLFNRILGFSRAIVYEQAGTTRDILREKTVLDGWNVEFIDTAGLHEAGDAIEREGIRRANAEILAADLILWIRDASQSAAEKKAEEEMLTFPPKSRVLTVWNKSDLAADASEIQKNDTEIYVSALLETGMETLLQKIVQVLIPVAPPAGTGMRL